MNHILSVSHADDTEDEETKDYISETNIAGFLVVYAFYLFLKLNSTFGTRHMEVRVLKSESI